MDRDEQGSSAARVAAVAALAIAVVAAALILTGGSSYKVKARFQAATQIVNGNVVQSAGRKVGVVEDVELTDDGQAEVTMKIDDDQVRPLRRGTHATIRTASLSGVANRYVDLRLPPAGRDEEIPDGGVIEASDTDVAVDLDQFFNMFDRRTRRGLTNFIRGQANLYGGKGREQNAGWHYLNPSLVASSRLFREINRDEPLLERFVVASSKLVTDLADRRQDLALLIDKLADTTGAIAQERRSLATAISRLPPFMRRANTTYVNLRATLDDVDPLIAETRPVAPKLRRYVRQLRFFAQDARPTFRDLAALIRRGGPDNDLIELARSTLPLRDITIGPVEANGRTRRGSFAESAESLKGQTRNFGFFRPYAVDLTGWFDDFSHSGIYDANGSASRIATSVNAFNSVAGVLEPLAPELRGENFRSLMSLGQTNRCPGAVERPWTDKSNPWRPSPDYNCDPSQVPIGP